MLADLQDQHMFKYGKTFVKLQKFTKKMPQKKTFHRQGIGMTMCHVPTRPWHGIARVAWGGASNP